MGQRALLGGASSWFLCIQAHATAYHCVGVGGWQSLAGGKLATSKVSCTGRAPLSQPPSWLWGRWHHSERRRHVVES